MCAFRLKENGSFVPIIKTSFPTITPVNHFAIATGKFPEKTGTVGDNLYDPKLKRRVQKTDMAYYMFNKRVKPIWVSAWSLTLRWGAHNIQTTFMNVYSSIFMLLWQLAMWEFTEGEIPSCKLTQSQMDEFLLWKQPFQLISVEKQITYSNNTKIVYRITIIYIQAYVQVIIIDQRDALWFNVEETSAVKRSELFNNKSRLYGWETDYEVGLAE